MKKILCAALMATSVVWFLQTPANADVKEAYEKNCKKCHGADGKGDTAKGKEMKLQDLSTAEYQKKATDEQILKAILEGVKDPKDPKRKMQGYKDKVSEAEAKDLVKMVRGFKK